MEESRRPLSVLAIKRQVRQRMRTIEEISRELGELEEMIPAPTPEEYEEIVRKRQPISCEALLLGAMKATAFHLSEASRIVETYACYTPSTVVKLQAARFWRDDLLQSLENVVRFRSEGPPDLDDDAEDNEC